MSDVSAKDIGLVQNVRPGAVDVRGQQPTLFPFDAFTYTTGLKGEARTLTLKDGWTFIVKGHVEASSGNIGGWIIDTSVLKDGTDSIVLDPTQKRISVKDSFGAVKAAFGYLGGIGTYGTNDFGLFIGTGNKVAVAGGGDFTDGDFFIKSDAAYVINSSLGTEVGRFGSLGLGAVGLSIGVDSGNQLVYSTATGVLSVSGAITATSGVIGGFTIDSSEGIYYGSGVSRVQLKPSSGIWLGATALVDAPFSVTAAGVLVASSGKVGNWNIGSGDLFDVDERIFLRPGLRRLEIRDSLDIVKVGLGYLSGIGSYVSTEYGLYIAPGNVVFISGGGEFSDGDYNIQSDAAYVVLDALGGEAVRLGSLGLGDVGLKIGDVTTGQGLSYSLDDEELILRGTFITDKVSVEDTGVYIADDAGLGAQRATTEKYYLKFEEHDGSNWIEKIFIGKSSSDWLAKITTRLEVPQIGVSADTDLLGLASAVLTVNGTAKVTTAIECPQIGVSADTDLLQLANGTLRVEGKLGIGMAPVYAKSEILNNGRSDAPAYTDMRYSSYTVRGAYNANYYYPLIGFSRTDNDLDSVIAAITVKLTNSGSKLYFGLSESYASGCTRPSALVIDYAGGVGIGMDTPGSYALVVQGKSNAIVSTVAHLNSYFTGVADGEGVLLGYYTSTGKGGFIGGNAVGGSVNNLFILGYNGTSWGLIGNHTGDGGFYFSVNGGYTEFGMLVSGGRGYMYSKSIYDLTTSASANVNIGGSPHYIYRSTSSIKYKTQVEDIEKDRLESVDKFRPVWFRSLCQMDRKDWSHYGLIAEEVEKIDPRLVQYGAERKDGMLEPEGVDYQRVAVLHLANYQVFKKTTNDRLEKIESQLKEFVA